jgi:hypothetical protein
MHCVTPRCTDILQAALAFTPSTQTPSHDTAAHQQGPSLSVAMPLSATPSFSPIHNVPTTSSMPVHYVSPTSSTPFHDATQTSSLPVYDATSMTSTPTSSSLVHDVPSSPSPAPARTPASTTTHATSLAEGHRSLVLRVHPLHHHLSLPHRCLAHNILW